MNSNSDNPKTGREFEATVANVLQDYYGKAFDAEVKIPIGKPAKDHKFDCASADRSIIVECKCYTWTETGNRPSAKMGFINQAVFYMSYLPKDALKVIALKKATHSRRAETLAEYYYRTNKHLLEGIVVMEIDTNTRTVKIMGA